VAEEEDEDENEDEETADSSELVVDNDDDVNDTVDRDTIDAPSVHFCGTNASTTKLLLRLLCVVNIVVAATAMYHNKNEMHDCDDCDFEEDTIIIYLFCC